MHWLTDSCVQVYDAAADQTTLTLTLAAADTSMSTLDSVSLRVTQSALSSQLETSAANESGLRMSERQTTLHSSCDDSGLQSSVEWRQITLVAGNATIQVGSCLVCLASPLAVQVACCILLHSILGNQALGCFWFCVGSCSRVKTRTFSMEVLMCAPRRHVCMDMYSRNTACIDQRTAVVYGLSAY